MKELFKATINRDTLWEMNHFHFHDPYELLLVTGGTCTFLLEADMVQAVRGTVLLMKSGLLHMSTSLPDAEYTRYVINFNPADLRDYSSEQTDLLTAFNTGTPYLQLSPEEYREIEPLFAACQERKDCFGNDVERNLLFLHLLIRLGALSREDRRSLELEETENTRNYLRARPIIRYILENPTDKLSLESVAELFYYNKHYLCRVFKTATGISVGKYITSVRIQYAATYLRQGYSVQESGAKAGFKNNSNFISTFRKVMNISPGQYRQHFRANFDPEL